MLGSRRLVVDSSQSQRVKDGGNCSNTTLNLVELPEQVIGEACFQISDLLLGLDNTCQQDVSLTKPDRTRIISKSSVRAVQAFTVKTISL